jgi:hypothetical protein
VLLKGIEIVTLEKELLKITIQQDEIITLLILTQENLIHLLLTETEPKQLIEEQRLVITIGFQEKLIIEQLIDKQHLETTLKQQEITLIEIRAQELMK